MNKIFIRKIFITIWFWLGVVIATIMTGLAVSLITLANFVFKYYGYGQIATPYTFVTMCIEDIMANYILWWMTIVRIWKLETYTHQNHDLNLLKEKNYILASNHSSLIDTLFMALLPFNKTYTYNLKWSKIPVFGWMCLYAGYIGIDTSSPEEKAKVVSRVVEKVNEGYSVMIYPEGKRSHSQQSLLPKLMTGAFRISRESKVDILPLTFIGMSNAVDRYGMADFADMKIIIGIPYKVSTEGDFTQDIEYFRNTIEKTLKSNQQIK